MPLPATPPLPDAPALTSADADQWRAARVWWRLESRWLALLPVATGALAVHAGRFTVQAADGAQHGFLAAPSRLLGRGPDLHRTARAVTAAAAAPERRPVDALPPTAVGTTLLLNRLCVVGYLLWTVGTPLLSTT